MGQIRKTGSWGAGERGRNYSDHKQNKPDTEARQSHVDGAAGQHKAASASYEIQGQWSENGPHVP